MIKIKLLLLLIILPHSINAVELFIFPDSGRSPYLNAINSAKFSIKLTVYTLDDPQIIDALKQAKSRHVKISIIYEPNQFFHEQKQTKIHKYNIGSQKIWNRNAHFVKNKI